MAENAEKAPRPYDTGNAELMAIRDALYEGDLGRHLRTFVNTHSRVGHFIILDAYQTYTANRWAWVDKGDIGAFAHSYHLTVVSVAEVHVPFDLAWIPGESAHRRSIRTDDFYQAIWGVWCDTVRKLATGE